MTTVFEALAAIAGRLPNSVSSIATGGGDMYVLDAYHMTRYQDDTYKGGGLFMLTGDAEGAVLPVTGNVQITGKITGVEDVWWVHPTEGDPVYPAKGDRYVLTPAIFDVGAIVSAYAEAIRSWGRINTEVTLGTGDGETTTFDLPTGTTGTIVRVYCTSEDADKRWELHAYALTSTGIEFWEAVEDGSVVTATVATTVDDYDTLTLTGELPDEMPLEYIANYGAYAAIRNSLGQPGVDNQIYEGLVNHFAEMAKAAMQQANVGGAKSKETIRLF